MSKNTCQLFYRSLFGLTVFFIFSTLTSCNKSDVEYGEAPLIELIQISLDTVREFKDVEILTIRYYDGNGDIGFPDPQDYAVFVRDTRLDNFDGFYIGPIAPLDANVPVTGEINIEFPNLFIFGNRNTEKTQFEIKVVDRAGNESNLLTTDPVVIIK